MNYKRFNFRDTIDDEVFLKKRICDDYTNKSYDSSLKDQEDLCELLNELYLWKIRYNALKEAHFTKMGGFSMERDGRGRYNILSENIIPKNSPVIQIKSPDAVWNDIVADIFSDLLTEEG